MVRMLMKYLGKWSVYNVIVENKLKKVIEKKKKVKMEKRIYIDEIMMKIILMGWVKKIKYMDNV